MKAFLYGIALQFKLDIRNKDMIIMYYLVPLVFFLFVGGIFTSVIPDAYETLIQSMTLFGTTMGAFLGTPIPLTNFYGSEKKQAYQVGGIPLWTIAICNFISSYLHLMIMSMIIFLIAPVIYDATIPDNIPLYFFGLSLYLAASLSIGTLLGLLVKSQSRLTMISQLLFLPSVMLSGIMFPPSVVVSLPNILQTLGKFFPATWGYRLMTGTVEKINLPIVVLLSMTICISLVSYYALLQLKKRK